MGEKIKRTKSAASKDMQWKHVKQMWSTYICVLHRSSVIIPASEIPDALEARSVLDELWRKIKVSEEPTGDRELQDFLELTKRKIADCTAQFANRVALT